MIKRQFVICIENRDYPAALEIRKVYEVLVDDKATARGFLRVVDESGDDYLYPEGYFVKIELPEDAEKALHLVS